MKKFLLPVFLIMLMVGCRNQSPTGQANDQVQEEPHPTQIMVDKFFSTLKKEDGVVPAFTELLGPYSYLLDKEDGPFPYLISRLQKEFETSGKFKGYEVITEKAIGSTLKIYRYLVNYQLQPLRFTFVFYNYGSWRLQEFQYDGTIIEELIEMMKYRDVE